MHAANTPTKHRFYHGTVDTFLDSIQKIGLTPSLKNAWRVNIPGCGELRECEPADRVHLSHSERRAIEYAETRVRYYAAEPGGQVLMFDTMEPITKDHDAPVLHAKPVVLVVELDEHMIDQMEEDDFDEAGVCFRGIIPPQCIVDIHHLSPSMREHHPDPGMLAFETLLSALR